MHKKYNIFHLLLSKFSCTFDNSSQVIIDSSIQFLPFILLKQRNLSRFRICYQLYLHLYIANVLHSRGRPLL